MEIERKFLPLDSAFILNCIKDLPSKDFTQAYLNFDPVIRIRKEDEKYVLTYKGHGMMAREEVNLPIPEDTFSHLLPKCDGYVISKMRYFYPLPLSAAFVETAPHSPILDHSDALVAEIDVFQDQFAGLILIEVEFLDETSANEFVPPAWFGREVTWDSHYHNSFLAKNGFLPDSHD